MLFSIKNYKQPRMKNSILNRFSFFALKVIAGVAITFNASGQQPAFPGAEGYGMYASGGRGGTVYYVTDTSDNATNPAVGTLRYGIEKLSGPRTILFKVSGVISLRNQLIIRNGDITIAGQTAPGDGICLRNYTMRLNASNIIVRYIRSRLGDVTAYVDDAMDANGTAPTVTLHDIIVDHCSLSWSIDEVGSFYDNKNFTLQWSILSESLYHSVDPKGNHGYGGIWGGQGATFHHNLLAHNTSRNPRFCGARYTGDTIHEIVDMRNNVLYNWGNINSAYGGEGGNQNIVNNYYKPGPATPGSLTTSSSTNKRNRILGYTPYYYATDSKVYPDTLFGGKFYVNGNYVEGYPDVTADNWTKGVQNDNTSYSRTAELMARNRLSAPVPFGNIHTQSATDAYIAVLDSVGAILPKRDTIDRRIIRETRTGTATFQGTYTSGVSQPSGIIDSQNDVGGWPVYNSAPPPVDTDNDGMPDAWETSHGLNPNDASDRNVVGSDGYTMLEAYLNSIGTSSSLPLNITSFTASVINGSSQANLSWTTANEINAARFEIEKSTNGTNFIKIGTVPAKNSITQNTYNFADPAIINSTSYYRLKLIDKDGAVTFSKIVVVGSNINRSGLSAFPNPANDVIAITHNKAGTNATIDIATIDGKRVIEQKLPQNAIQTSVDISALKAGTYLIIYKNGSEKLSTRFVKQ
jgi:hypothetical protein